MIEPDDPHLVVGVSDRAGSIMTYVDIDGIWHLSVKVNGRVSLWRPDDRDNAVDALNDPAPSLTDVLDHIILTAARKASS